ncbi:unnamed protein product [Ixodes hexagonus]
MLPVAGIFGQDVLRGEDIDLLLSEGVLRIGKARVDITNWYPQTDSGGGRRPCGVTLTRPCVLPPLSECLFEGKLSSVGAPGRLGVLEVHDLGVNGVSGAHALVRTRDDGTVPVRLVNVTGQEMHLPRNKVVGTLVDAEEITPTIPEVGECNCADETDLLSQFDFSHTTIEERDRLLELIDEYRDAFSTTRTDIGRCDAVRHRISTAGRRRSTGERTGSRTPKERRWRGRWASCSIRALSKILPLPGGRPPCSWRSPTVPTALW